MAMRVSRIPVVGGGRVDGYDSIKYRNGMNLNGFLVENQSLKGEASGILDGGGKIRGLKRSYLIIIASSVGVFAGRRVFTTAAKEATQQQNEEDEGNRRTPQMKDHLKDVVKPRVPVSLPPLTNNGDKFQI
ncbi:hypothetical protein L2E82_27929 [Cichorium intybus]|uniref:Uncharacterized protein n=1 Tax=Cichorium intybus TaxID=13427 RepID=A0ACB9CUE1_CICIN|nr:hypothetical protein L2E82_27929 [Cichorium intybus]